MSLDKIQAATTSLVAAATELAGDAAIAGKILHDAVIAHAAAVTHAGTSSKPSDGGASLFAPIAAAVAKLD